MLGIPFLDDAITKWFRPTAFDDPVDRLNYFVTATLLAFFAVMVSAKQYVGAPIQCWMPMEFKGGWEQYAEDYCFIQNTFFIPFHEEIPTDTETREEAQIGYYQWVPIMLALQAIMFYLPNWIWKTLHQQSGIDMQTAVSDAQKLRSIGHSDRKRELAKLSDYIVDCLEFKQSYRSPFRFMCFNIGKGGGSFVAMLYLFVKFLYVCNIFGQFYLLNTFLGSDYHFWGFQTFLDLMSGREWLESGVFPRVTLCDFKVRRLANVHRYTVQCVLMINMFNEKIYLFLWFWFLFVMISTVINFFYCCFQLIPSGSRTNSCRRWLSDSKEDQPDHYNRTRIIGSFAQRGLKPDGVLLMRFIEGHAGAIVARELTSQLFSEYFNDVQTGISDHSTKTTSPGLDDGLREQLYPPGKMGLLEPDFGKQQMV
ncbi:unnamed protein product, partial [Mesorhabditis belari]|uniref:Innexin n=1 Tax=Mesorhabditis belari TaxID=2138241 RepID=A0AAF3EGZ6_9BILA